MRTFLLFPLLGLGLAACAADPPPMVSTTTYQPATQTVVTQPARGYSGPVTTSVTPAPNTTTYVTPDRGSTTYVTPGATSSTTVIRQQ